MSENSTEGIQNAGSECSLDLQVRERAQAAQDLIHQRPRARRAEQQKGGTNPAAASSDLGVDYPVNHAWPQPLRCLWCR